MGAVQYIGTGRLGASQDVAYGSSSAASSAFGTQTYKVRLVATTDCRIRISDGTPTAVASRGNSGVVGRHAQRDRGFVMAFGRLGAGSFGRMGLPGASVLIHLGLLLRDGTSHLLLRAGGTNFLLLGH